jgi:hypothetical protein
LGQPVTPAWIIGSETRGLKTPIFQEIIRKVVPSAVRVVEQLQKWWVLYQRVVILLNATIIHLDASRG